MIKTIDQRPTVSDEVLIRITTTDTDGNPVNPYKVSKVTIYFIERDFTISRAETVDLNINGEIVTTYFKDAVPVKVFGDPINPAWLSSDTSLALITKIDTDEDGNPLIGNFDVQWNPDLAREGDYVICWSWASFPAADEQSASLTFILYSDTQASTSIPTHATVPNKYKVLLDRYLPDFIKDTQLGRDDLTYDVLSRFNDSVAQSFTTVEDLANQILDLQDANVLSEGLLPYLSNFFRHRLWSSDTQLWRRQIKRAIPLYKKKGTLSGLTEALDSAGIKLQRLVKLWQVVSKSTWQEAFKVSSGQTEFVLAKSALLSIDSNYILSLRPEGDTSYVGLPISYVSFSVFGDTTKMTWVGPFTLNPNDIIRIIYKIANPVSQAIEDFIRSLPLADTRDETTFIYPLKNWNVRLIEEDDPMFSIIIPARHPYRLPVIWGKVRTEFAYSEKVYNQDEYDGCQVGSATIITENGLKKLKDITSDDKLILTEFGFRKFETLKNQGKRQTIKITTKMGRELIVTPNHKFRVINNDGKLEWKQAADLTKNDYILGKRGSPDIPKSKGIDKDFWYLAGFVYGDGFLYKDLIHWLIPEKELESKTLIEHLISNFGGKFNVRKRTVKKHQKHTCLKCNQEMYIVTSSGNQLPELSKILPSYKKKGRWRRHVPNLIWQSGEEQICSFLGGLFDTDGSVQKGNPMLTTKWITLAKEVQRLLLLLGMISSVTSFKSVWKGKKRKYFRVRVFGKQSVKIFLEKISFKVKVKKNALENDYFSTNVKGAEKKILGADRTIIPNATEIIRSIFYFRKRISCIRSKNRSKEEKRILTLITQLKQGYRQTIPDNVANNIFEKAEIYGKKDNEYFKFLKDYTENDWFFDKVEKIKEGKEEIVYDPLNVEETCSYLSEGLVSHNSLRDSIDPCDIDRSFVDVCSDCQSSKISLTLEIEKVEDDRVREASQIINEFIPFHAELQVVNYAGAVNEFFIPPVEEIEVITDIHFNENVFIGQSDFTRVIRDAVYHTGELFRDMLASSMIAATANDGIGFNGSFVLYTPGLRFDLMGIKPAPENLLEILSGPNFGVYTVNYPGRSVVTIDNGSPDKIEWPLDTSEFAYNLSNKLFSTASASIIQDDLFTFIDPGVDFALFEVQTAKNSLLPWKILITSGPYAGSYIINDFLPDNSLVIEGWPTIFNVNNLLYNVVTNDLSTTIIDRSTDGDGSVTVFRRARVETTDLQNDWGIQHGDFVRYSGIDYKIIGFADAAKAYIEGYTLGSAAGVPIIIYRRLVDGGVGFLDERGAYLITSIDYEALLEVQNGANPPIVKLENNSFKENYLIRIGSNYYEIAEWNGTRIDLVGPKIDWGLGGIQNVSFEIVRFIKTENITVNDVTFRIIDRRGEEPITEINHTVVPFAMRARAAVLNSESGKGIIETITQDESIDIEIIWKDGESYQGELWS